MTGYPVDSGVLDRWTSTILMQRTALSIRRSLRPAAKLNRLMSMCLPYSSSAFQAVVLTHTTRLESGDFEVPARRRPITLYYGRRPHSPGKQILVTRSMHAVAHGRQAATMRACSTHTRALRPHSLGVHRPESWWHEERMFFSFFYCGGGVFPPRG